MTSLLSTEAEMLASIQSDLRDSRALVDDYYTREVPPALFAHALYVRGLYVQALAAVTELRGQLLSDHQTLIERRAGG